MPNDDKEQDRLDLTHHIWLLVLGGELYNAPLNGPRRILDLGTGTGIWALDMADKFPEAHVIGNDISPIQPQWVPPNLEFLVDDFEKDWLDKPSSFDFIHARDLSGSVTDWPRLFRQAFVRLRPGGYFEVQESAQWVWSPDGTVKDDSVTMKFVRNLDAAGKQSGRELNIYHRLSEWAKSEGFVDVTERTYIVPYTPWPKDSRLKEIGRYVSAMILDGLDAYGLRLHTQILGWSVEETQILHALVRGMVRDRSEHSYTTTTVVYARKPPLE
ncbi:UMTA methyltransferase family protein [Talaromyces proteolyticus]|uniref:UMTA methyltransferase family protein n=1 Tax=Talaromyces proteolyticus TaxID=1131652 RepID=A0AAD4KWH3_9EURO|nr:UMTA methyltransferase family protein [Talaromyces proteolyticus]KAH8700502.1 UMTA methyltransferase family protein [Talaromyces proteolyticus]